LFFYLGKGTARRNQRIFLYPNTAAGKDEKSAEKRKCGLLHPDCNTHRLNKEYVSLSMVTESANCVNGKNQLCGDILTSGILEKG